MNADVKATCLAALDEQRSLLTVVACLDDDHPDVVAIDKAKAALEVDAPQGSWQPVEDGEYDMGQIDEPLYIFGNTDPDVCTHVEYANETVMLDLGMTICRRIDNPALQVSEGMTMPTIVCLCGSTRFYEAFVEANFHETMAGNIVLTVGFFLHRPEMVQIHGETVGITPDDKIMLDALHMRKIDLADEVLILNVGGYIGESTAQELAYARKLGKKVRFLETDATQPQKGEPQ